MTDYVYLKLQKFSGTDLTIDTIPLKVTTAQFSVDKTIPNFSIPFAGLGKGQSKTIALDTGMATRRLSLSGVIIDASLKRSHTLVDPNDSTSAVKSLDFTAQEIAQLIASGVDATGLNEYQAFQEITILIDSKVNKDYQDRGQAADASVTQLGTVITQIPFTFKARGNAGELDNKGAFLGESFPTSSTSTGLKGFVSSFGFTLSAESIDIEFNMEFTIADVMP